VPWGIVFLHQSAGYLIIKHLELFLSRLKKMYVQNIFIYLSLKSSCGCGVIIAVLNEETVSLTTVSKLEFVKVHYTRDCENMFAFIYRAH
jgi:hypothetical protein